MSKITTSSRYFEASRSLTDAFEKYGTFWNSTGERGVNFRKEDNIFEISSRAEYFCQFEANDKFFEFSIAKAAPIIAKMAENVFQGRIHSFEPMFYNNDGSDEDTVEDKEEQDAADLEAAETFSVALDDFLSVLKMSAEDVAEEISSFVWETDQFDMTNLDQGCGALSEGWDFVGDQGPDDITTEEVNNVLSMGLENWAEHSRDDDTRASAIKFLNAFVSSCEVRQLLVEEWIKIFRKQLTEEVEV